MWRLSLCLAGALQGSAVLGVSIGDSASLLQQHLAADARAEPPANSSSSSPIQDTDSDDSGDASEDTPSCQPLDHPRNSLCVGEVEWGSRVGKLQDKASKWYADMIELINVSYAEGTKEDFQRYWYCKGFLYVKAPESEVKKACGMPPCTCSSPPCDICLPLKAKEEAVAKVADEDLEELDMTIDEYVRERLWERVQELGHMAVDKTLNVSMELSADAAKHVKQAIRDMTSSRLKGSRTLKYKFLTKLSKQRMVGIEKLSKRLAREHLKNVKRFKDHEDAIHRYEKNRKEKDAHYERIYKARTEGNLTAAEAEEAAHEAGNTPEQEAKRLHDIYKRHHDHDVWVQHKMQTQIDSQERADRLKRRAQYEAEHPNDEVRDDEDKPGYIDGLLDDGRR